MRLNIFKLGLIYDRRGMIARHRSIVNLLINPLLYKFGYFLDATSKYVDGKHGQRVSAFGGAKFFKVKDHHKKPTWSKIWKQDFDFDPGKIEFKRVIF